MWYIIFRRAIGFWPYFSGQQHVADTADIHVFEEDMSMM